MFLELFRFIGNRPADANTLDDLRLLEAGFEYDDAGRLRYAWRKIRIRNDGSWTTAWQVVRLYCLSYLPADEAYLASRHQAMAKALRGLLASGVTPIYLKVVNPEEGVAQVYGVSVLEEDGEGAREKAVRRSENAAAALLAALRGAYPQSGYEPPDVRLVAFLDEAFQSMTYAIAMRGQPDPREAPASTRISLEKGAEVKSGMGRPQEIGLRQGEIVSQGMAAQGLPMVQVSILSPVGFQDGHRELSLLYQRLARNASAHRSRVQGVGSIGVSFGLPIIASASVGEGSTAGYGTTRTHSTGESLGVSVQKAHTDAWSYAKTTGHSIVHSESWSEADTVGGSHSVGVSHTTSHSTGKSETHSESWGTADTRGWADTHGSATTTGTSTTYVPEVTTTSSTSSWSDTQGSSQAESSGHATTSGFTDSWGESYQSGTSGSFTEGASGGVKASLAGIIGTDASINVSRTDGWSEAQGTTTGHASSFSTTDSSSTTTATSQSHTSGGSFTTTTTPAHTITTTSSSTTSSYAHTESGSHTVSHSTGVAHGTSESWGESTSRSEVSTSSWAHTVAHGRGIAEGWSEAETRGVSGADSRGAGVSAGTSSSVAVGATQAQALSITRGMGLGVGLSPAISLSRSYNLVDHEQGIIAQAMEEQMAHVDRIIREGGVYADTYFLVPSAEAKQALQALVHQAYHGTEGVVTPVHTLCPPPEEEEYIRTHAYLFVPATVPETSPYALEAWKYSSLLATDQAAAIVVPEIFEYGRARTVARRLPRYAIHRFPQENALFLGYQFSSDLNDFTRIPLYLPLPWFINAFVAGSSGVGKSVLLGRVAYELQKKGVLVFFFDLGDGQRDLLHALEPGRYELRGIAPGHPRRMRWNPLQVARRIHPEDYVDLLVEVVSNAGALGPKQRSDLADALKAMYADLGVFTDDPAVWKHPRWGILDGGEVAAVNAERQRRRLPPRPRQEDLRLEDLEDFELQAVAVWRSRRASFASLYQFVEQIQESKPGGKKAAGSSQDSIEGLKNRLRPLMRRTIDPGQWLDDPEPLDGYRDRFPDGGVILVEGVGVINEYVKAVWFSLAVSVLFLDAVARFNVSENDDPGARQEVAVIYDEGNKLLTAGATIAADDRGAGPTTSPIFVRTLREGRKYRFRSVIGVQDPEDVPEAIITNCSVYFAGPIRSEKGLRVVMTKMGFSPTGFVRNEYWEDFAKRQKYVFTTRFAMADRREDQEPCLLVAAPLPTVRIYDKYLQAYFGQN